MMYNIYFGTIGKTLGVKYRYTKNFKSELDAIKNAENEVFNLYLRNEGKYGIPSYNDIEKESKITGVDIEKLYQEHVKDMTRFYIIPTELDTISQNDLNEI